MCPCYSTIAQKTLCTRSRNDVIHINLNKTHCTLRLKTTYISFFLYLLHSNKSQRLLVDSATYKYNNYKLFWAILIILIAPNVDVIYFQQKRRNALWHRKFIDKDVVIFVTVNGLNLRYRRKYRKETFCKIMNRIYDLPFTYL